MPPTPSSTGDDLQQGDDRQLLSSTVAKMIGPAADSPLLGCGGYRVADLIKWVSLPLLVVQNSSLFLAMRYSRLMHEDHYHPTVAVFVTELVKFAIALGMVLIMERKNGMCAGFRKLIRQRSILYTLAVPALCFTGQNNLLFVGVSYLPAASVQVLVQSKTLWAAFFSVLLLGRRFSCIHWTSFVFLVAGVVLVQDGDAKPLFSSAADHTDGAFLGVVASLSAAILSGFAGVFLEKTFNRRSATLWELNVLLALLSLPLQALAILEFDRAEIHERGLFYGFHADTWLVILIQAVGGLLTAVVIKYAGNMLKSFATSVSLISTSFISIPMMGYSPTAVFWFGLALVCTATTLYGLPQPKIWPWKSQSTCPARTAPVDEVDGTRTADGDEDFADILERHEESLPDADEEQSGQAAGARRMRFTLGSRATRFTKMVDDTRSTDAPGSNHGIPASPKSTAISQRSAREIELAPEGLSMASTWLDLD